jgi:hypothetical protein
MNLISWRRLRAAGHVSGLDFPDNWKQGLRMDSIALFFSSLT